MSEFGERTLHGAKANFPSGLVNIADDVCAWFQPNGDWSESNAGLIIGTDAAALIDTAWDLPQTQRLLRAVEHRTDRPIRTLVATHGDGDHVNGFQLIPEAELVASVGTAVDIDAESPGGLRRSQLGAHFLRSVTVGPPRRFGDYITNMMDPFDFRGIRLRKPGRTFDRELTLNVGGRILELKRLGPAHTSGDTIVHVPDASVVFTGDLLFNGVTPNSWSGTVDRWLRALDEIGSLGARHLVPGHGPLSNNDDLDELGSYWRWLQRSCSPLLDSGASVYAAARKIVLSDEFAELPWSSWQSPERTVLNVEIIARSRRPVLRPIAHRERPALMWNVARLRLAIDEHRRPNGERDRQRDA